MTSPSGGGFISRPEAEARAARLDGFEAALEAAPKHPPLDRLYAHWRALAAANGDPPPRKSFDPLAAPRDVLAHLVLSVPVDGGADFRHRLVGATVVDWFGVNATGKTLGRMFDRPALKRVLPVFQLAYEAGRPLTADGVMDYWRNKDFVGIEALVLPFADTPDGPVSHLLQGLAFRYV